MEFPRLVYKSAAEHLQVNDESEMNTALDSGFFASVPEAIEGKHASAKATKKPKAPAASDGWGAPVNPDSAL